MRKLIQEFKEFAVRGNVIDLAVGIIIGGAFGKIVSSLVADVIMPPIGLLIGGVDFSSLSIVLKQASPGQAGVEIAVGKFVQTVVDFLIISAAIFFLVKAVNSLRRENEQQPAPPVNPQPGAEEKLLTEIRDILKQRQ